MHIQTVDIEFNQLVRLVKRLPINQWAKLKQEVDKNDVPQRKFTDTESFLLTAPTFTKKQLDEISKNKKAINQWRTK
jgi:hypothetical protein